MSFPHTQLLDTGVTVTHWQLVGLMVERSPVLYGTAVIGGFVSEAALSDGTQPAASLRLTIPLDLILTLQPGQATTVANLLAQASLILESGLQAQVTTPPPSP